MYDKIYSHFVYPVYHAFKRDGFNVAIKQAFEYDALSAKLAKQRQNKKLRALVLHAALNIPYYKNMLGSLAAGEITLDDFPIIDKSLINSRREEFIWQSKKAGVMLANSTSGSSGEPFEFFTDMRSQAHRIATKFVNQSWIGINRGDKKFWLWGAAFDLSHSETWRGKLRTAVTREVYLNSANLADQNFQEYHQFLIKFQPRLMVSYPGPLTEFANFCLAKNIKLPSVKAIVTSAETLYKPQRDLIEKAFAVRVFNRYGSREFGDIAQEELSAQGFKINLSRVFVEVLDDSGKVCPEGEEGELVITDLDNYGMPLIRYRIGDRAAFMPNSSGLRLAQVSGRSMDIITFPNGKKVGGTFWTLLLRSKPGIKQFQIHQTNENSLDILYVRDTGFNDELKIYIKEKIYQQAGNAVKINFKDVGFFDIPKNGKHKIVRKSLVGDE